MINNIKQGIFYFLKKCHLYPIEHISVFIVFKKVSFLSCFRLCNLFQLLHFLDLKEYASEDERNEKFAEEKA